jgi:drug/metabolite transporter (DMT)-like permease
MLQPLANLTGIFFAMTSAVVWGGADFSGGLASRRTKLFQVLALSGFSGIVMLVVFALLWQEVLPSFSDMLWAAAAGTSGLVGIAALYRALSMGYTASVAPTAAVIGTVSPVLFSVTTQGTPGAVRLVGFGVALLGIWLASQSTTKGEGVTRLGFLLACTAGVFFGGFFILIAQVHSASVFMPLLFARLASLGLVLLLLLGRRTPLPSLSTNPTALLAGILDAGGNVFYLLATHFIRLDVAVVLSSLYPASTVVLANLVLKEEASIWQWAGVALCLAAIILITI